MVFEEVVYLAAVPAEYGCGSVPVEGLWVAVEDVLGDEVARPEPDFDGPFGPFHDVGAAAVDACAGARGVVVEAVAVGVFAVVDDGAALVGALPGGVDVAVGGD